MSDWQPIDTIPKEPLDRIGYGPTVMLYVDDTIGIGFWDQDFNRPYVEYPEGHGSVTHWRPMPVPPSA